jgi:hypothetical protein
MGTRTTILVTVCVIIAVLVFFELFMFRTSMQQTTDPYFKTYYSEFNNTPTLFYNNVPTSSYNYSFSPPISMYNALLIVAENDDWNATSLKNVTVCVEGLDYCAFNTYGGFTQIHPVSSPPVSWSPQQVNGITYRYVWIIATKLSLSSRLEGLCLVDAATAEVFKFALPAP